MRPAPIAAAQQIFQEKFSDAKAFFLAGSILRGEETENSDLDLVVVYEKLTAAWRESFDFQGWPVEVFVHDPATLRFFFERDRKAGLPVLSNMVLEGLELPAATEFSQSLKDMARASQAGGPEALTEPETLRYRYVITDLCDDLKNPRSNAEANATAIRLYGVLSEYFLRSRRLWCGTGKSLFRQLEKADADFAQRFNSAFEKLFSRHDTSAIFALAEGVLSGAGGYLFEGYKSYAPMAWRKAQASRTPPVLSTKRLLLRLPTPRDVPAILRHFRENEAHFAPTDPPKADEYYTESFWAERVALALEEFAAGQSARLVLFRAGAEHEVIGTLNLTNIMRGPFQACYLGYGLAATAQGQGLMKEGVRAAIDYAFSELKLHRIMANHLPANIRSGRLLAQLGFVIEGLGRNYLFINGQWRDHTLTALLNPDWTAQP